MLPDETPVNFTGRAQSHGVAYDSDAYGSDSPHEECGVFGVSTPHGEGVAQTVFFGLFALQHRGQEAAGIAVSDGSRVRLHKDSGLVANVFTPATMNTLAGYHGIGHTRYSTTGANALRNIQPFLVETMHGPLALAHNGNLVNAPALRDELLGRGFGLTATSDTEVMTLMLAAAGGKTWEDRVERTLPAWKGAFSLVILAADRVIAVRDPWGFRPMSVGRLPHGGYAVASETCALNTLGCLDINEVAPGEIVTLSGAEITRRQALTPAARSARCTFEFVYFSRPDSVWADRNMHHVRQRLGEELAAEAPADADVVIPVPDSSIPAAIGFSRASGIPHNDGLIKNRYIGRTFIEPTQDLRERGVALKFNALAENLAGKRVIMIDDSLVRGTTAGPLVKLLRDAGATEVHVRITCPPITHACHFGVDMGHDGDLMAARLTVEEMREHIDADSLAFLSLDGMMRAITVDPGDEVHGDAAGYCNACFTGHYPMEVAEAQAKLSFEGVLA
jgi:amidophosphoribosyltransferase